MNLTIRACVVSILGLMLVAGPVQGAPGPDLINYQGVLRDSTGPAVTTDANGIDVAFRFFDSLTGGNELLVDSHLIGGSGGVVVTDGLFNVAIGSGSVTVGSGMGAVSTLGALFKAFPTLYLEVEIASETLNPRTRVNSAPYALNALDENDVDLFVSNNGYALQANLASVATSGSFDDLTSLPPGLSDGDDDVLSDLACQSGQVPQWSGSAWSCADVTPVTSPELTADTELAFPFRHEQVVDLGPFEFVVGTLRTWHTLGGELVMPMMSANNLNYATAYVQADELAGTLTAVGWDYLAAINNLGDKHNLAILGGNVRYTAFDRLADYDSNWFACSVNQTYPIAHDLGVFPHFALVEVAQNSDGSGWRVPTMSSSNFANSSWTQTAMVALDPNNATVRTHEFLFDMRVTATGLRVIPTSAYCRVRLFDWMPEYDSGWVPVSSAPVDRDVMFEHDLGQTPSLQMLYVAENSDGSGWCLPAMGSFHSNFNNGVGLYATTGQWATIKVGAASLAQFVDDAGLGQTPTIGYVRYMAWR